VDKVTIWSYSGGMTRGKNATASAGRRYQAEHDKQIEMYQRKVAELASENKKMAATLDSERIAHRATVQNLSAQVQEGTSADLQAATARIRELQDELGVARTNVRMIVDTWEKFQMRFTNWAMGQLGITLVGATELKFELSGEQMDYLFRDAAEWGTNAEKVRFLAKQRRAHA
jgi:hypothetical protein